MLRSFRLANHRSFLDEQELLLMPSAPGRDHEALTVAAIYGANASGKSNLLDGLAFMAQAVDESFRVWRADEGVPRKPFGLGSTGRLQPSTFVVEVMIAEVPYTYGFSVDDAAVQEEWLYSYPENRKRILFERAGKDVKFGTAIRKLSSLLGDLDVFARPNTLFLSLFAQLDLSPFGLVSRWFTKQLQFRGGSLGVVHDRELVPHLARYLDDDELRPRLVGLLTAADTGITDIYVHGRRGQAGTRGGRGKGRKSSRVGSPARAPELRFAHGDGGDSFGIKDESDGTRNWLHLLPAVLDALDRGGTLVVDEIDASLHPLLTVRLLDLFSSDETNPRHAQLIFTTHGTTPLGSYVGREVLRRDQVWFVEKDGAGRSKLYPLSDFKPRSGENAEKRYLGGSYGAVPVLSDLDFGESAREQA